VSGRMAPTPRRRVVTAGPSRQRRHRALLWPAVAVLAAAAMAAPLRAQASDTVILSPIMVRVVSHDQKHIGIQHVTVTLEIPDPDSARYVCAVAPRLRDAIVRDLNRTHFVLDRDGGLTLDGLGKRLQAAMADVLDRDVIEAVHVAPGAPDLPSTVVVRLNRQGCMRRVDEDAPRSAETESEH
jgi:hypothetical protein